MADNCGCGDILITIPGGGIPGPQGPPGPPGPPGPGATFPIPADQISVTNIGFANLQALLDFLMYIPTVINSFSAAIPVYEIGSSVSNLTFNWSLNQNPTSQSITGPQLTPPVLTVGQRVVTVTLNSPLNPSVVGTTFTYQLSVVDAFNTVNANAAVSFFNSIYFGDAAIPGLINSAFVNTLTKVVQSSRSRNFTSNAGPGVYAWFAHRAALGTAVFSVGGFPGGFEAPVIIPVTNPSGFTENFNVYRSTNPNIGPVSITAS
jgi:hypothetical protein